MLERAGYCEWDKVFADNKAYLAEKYPWLLFLGDTVGGDVGAELYVHRTDGKIDSLIIEKLKTPTAVFLG